MGSGLARWLYEADARVTGASRAARKRLGLAAKLRILPYRGYGTPDRVVVKARVVEDRGALDPSVRRGLFGAAAASVARFRTAEVARARVRVHFGDDVHEGVTDDEGFLDLAVTPPLWAGPGWHRVGIEVAPPEVGDPVHADVLLVGPNAKHAIITDIDDTIILTGVRNLARRAWSLFMADAAGRRVFEGTSALYRGLAAGGSGGEPGMECPVVYVSSSPWNLYNHLEHFLDENGLPKGPILLRDWGLTREGFAPDGKHHHKLEKSATCSTPCLICPSCSSATADNTMPSTTSPSRASIPAASSRSSSERSRTTRPDATSSSRSPPNSRARAPSSSWRTPPSGSREKPLLAGSSRIPLSARRPMRGAARDAAFLTARAGAEYANGGARVGRTAALGRWR